MEQKRAVVLRAVVRDSDPSGMVDGMTQRGAQHSAARVVARGSAVTAAKDPGVAEKVTRARVEERVMGSRTPEAKGGDEKAMERADVAYTSISTNSSTRSRMHGTGKTAGTTQRMWC